MKDWLKIGEFSELSGLSPKALRLYGELGILIPKNRGENNYRFYGQNQLKTARSINQYKKMGFSLEEIKKILNFKVIEESCELKEFLKKRLGQINLLQQDLENQRKQLASIITSLEKDSPKLSDKERRYIMSRFKSVSVVVTGINNLKMTGEIISQTLSEGTKSEIPIYTWRGQVESNWVKPYILLLPEADLIQDSVCEILPDVVVINNISDFNSKIEKCYLNLYQEPDVLMTTVFNADDALSIKLASNPMIRKSRFFYFTKNKGLENQIKKIGGVVSDGEEVRIYGFNLKKQVVKYKFKHPLAFAKEVAILASASSLLDVGLSQLELKELIK